MPTPILTDSELRSLPTSLPHWSIRERRLVREWTFPDFTQAMLFVNRVAGIAERANHHPDIDIRYNRVLLSLISHDSGGLTSRDTALAGELNHIAP